ncbi:methylated-DNA--[protein]-cysteine S-methyltransferase [Orbaceae bacterium ESL0721]|nr:methylated-DNA--[protein]-cysteine S-methyltransferase [Orbaceae bacterium ESL0721]
MNFTQRSLLSTNNLNKDLIHIKQLDTPIGVMYAGATDRGLSFLEFIDSPKFDLELKHLLKYATLIDTDGLDNDNLPIINRHLIQTEKELKEYFSGERRQFSIALDTKGTFFQQKVWNALMTIPYGKTRSYKDQAVDIDHPKAVRAVANANGMNLISIIIPCHRVIGSNGKLTGYAGGLWRKEWLLEHEKKCVISGN